MALTAWEEKKVIRCDIDTAPESQSSLGKRAKHQIQKAVVTQCKYMSSVQDTKGMLDVEC